MRSILAVTGLAVAMAAVSAPGVVLAADSYETVEATGQAAVMGGDEAGAKAKAKQDALRNAIEKVVGSTVRSASSVKDFQLMSDVVSTHSEGVAKDVVYSEEKIAAGVASAKVTAKVSKEFAEDSFYAVMLASNHPKVAFIIAERMAGQTDFSLANQERGKTENMMTEYFIDRGARVVDLGGLTGINLNGAASSGELSAADAEKVAEKADAQYVVVGKVVGVDAGPAIIQGIRSYNMSLTLKMFSTSTHEIVASTTVSNAIPCISPNLAPVSCAKLYKERVVNLASANLMAKTQKAFMAANVTGSKRVQIRAKVANFAALQKFTKSLPDEVRGVTSVSQRSFSGGNAMLDIELTGGDVNYLASELSAKKIGGSTVEVTGMKGDQLEIDIKK